MVSFGVAVPYLVLALLAVALLWGSILAVRGRRWWAPVLMVVGSGMQVFGALLTCGGAVWMMVGVMGPMRSPGGSSASGMASAMAPMMFLMGGGAVLLGLGYVVFAAGFVGFSARYGAAERRAAELEGLVEGLQERMDP